MNPPTNDELILWLRDAEHSFAERKLFSDSKDWLKTVVAFANSTPTDYPAILYIGVKDDGSPDKKAIDLDSVQKEFSRKVGLVYPPVYYETRILDVEATKVLAVIVPGSRSRPHFAGPSYVRDGSKTVIASKEQFDRLIAQRISKAYKILEWKGKTVTLGNIGRGQLNPSSYSQGIVVDCDQFYVTVDANGRSSLPLDRIEISFDDGSNRLELIRLPA